MQPPILRWKVMVLLLAVVVAAVSLGSALRPADRSGWTSYRPVPVQSHQVPRAVLRQLFRQMHSGPGRVHVHVPVITLYERAPDRSPLDNIWAWLESRLHG